MAGSSYLLFSPPPPPPSTISVRVNASSDDAEQNLSTGTVVINSSDLELAVDVSASQLVGMRFNGIAIPAGATITSAYVEFETDVAWSTACSLTIQGQAADNPTTFVASNSNLSARSKTTASVAWSPSAWNTVNEKHQSPNLSSIVQEIVNRSGWASGNSMVIFVQGTGTREAESYDGEAAAAPLLVVEYSTGSTQNPLEGNEGFQILSEGNLTFTGYTHVHGPLGIGGNLILNNSGVLAEICMDGVGSYIFPGDGSTTTGLLVKGGVTWTAGGAKVMGGKYMHIGNSTGCIQSDNGVNMATQVLPTGGSYNQAKRIEGALDQTPSPAVFQSVGFDFTTLFNNYRTVSATLESAANTVQLQNSNGVDITGNNVTSAQNVQINTLSNGVNYLDLSQTSLNNITELKLNSGATPSASKLLVITVPLTSNFVWNNSNMPGLSGFNNGAYILWNFYGSSTYNLTINTASLIIGTIFAPNHNLIKTGTGDIDGNLIAKSMQLGLGEIHFYPFNGNVPINTPSVEICNNGIDDDSDGLTDGADPDCGFFCNTGSLTLERWLSISGTAITDLTGNANYPNSPSEIGTLTSFDAPDDYADNYGTRVRGFISPTQSGNYLFNLTSDDASELFLSTDASSSNKVMIASVAGWTGTTEHTKYTTQTSSSISLVAGQNYYVELLHKEGTGGDHFQVYWQTPSSSTWTIIPGSNLRPISCSEICNNGLDDDGDGLIDCEDPDCGAINITLTEDCETQGIDLTLSGGTAPYSFVWSDTPIPTAQWTFENSTNDVSGNGHHENTASSLGTPTYSNDAVEGQTSVSLNGSTYLRYSIDGAFMEVAFTEWMMAAWIKPTALTGIQTIIDEGGGTNGISVRLNSNILEFAARNGGVQVNAGTLTYPNDGAWHHIAAIFANDSLTLYLDGVAGTSTFAGFGAGGVGAHSGNGGIGYYDGGSGFGSGSGNYFTGLMDDFKYFFNQSLTASQIADLARNDGDRENLAAGTYSVSVQDSDGGCTANETITINLNCVEICNNGIDDDGDGLVDSADPECQSTDIYLEAECATLGSNWNIVTDATAANGEYVTIQSGLNSTTTAPTGVADRISFTFDVPSTGNYKVFGRVKAVTASDDSYWVRANGGIWYKWNDLVNTNWTWTQVYDSDNAGAAVLFSLAAGSNTIDIAYREDGAQLDKIYITQNGSIPSGLGATATNCVDEICGNGIDDDGDGLVDEADPDCFNFCPTGGLSFERWLNIGGGTTIPDLTGNANYPDNPTETGILTSFDGPDNYADNYGVRVRGYITPSETGTYLFNLTCDDNGEVYLSTDANAANKSLIANVADWTNPTEHTKFASQTSSSINLVAGQNYYVELLLKEGGGGDHFQVYWQTPSNSTWTIIPGSNLRPFSCFEICGNGLDDDGDGNIDYADSDCSTVNCTDVPGQNDIVGTVYLDQNSNQIFENGESTGTGITLNLYQDNDQDGKVSNGDVLIQTDVTDIGGAYSFTVVPSYTATYSGSINDGCNDARNDNNSENRIEFGKDKDIGVRFDHIDLPAGSTISSAYLYFTANKNVSNNGSVNIYAQNVLKPVDFCTDKDVNGRARTTAFVGWSFSNWVQNTEYQSVDIKNVIQELVNDHGAYSDGKMALILISNGSNNVEAKSYETNGNGIGVPLLVINYTGGTTANYVVQIDESTLPANNDLTTAPELPVSFSALGSADCDNNFGYNLAEICNNGIDDNGNGLIDCDDPSCSDGLSLIMQGEATTCNASVNISVKILGGTSPYSYSWSNGLGSSSSHNVNPTSTTSYTVTVTDANGCTAVDQVTITIDCSDPCSINSTDSYLDGIANAEELIPTGSYIINMGVQPQTVANALKPYGLVWELLHEEQVPIKWAINSNKAKDGIDFTHNGVNYKGGPFIVLAQYRTTAVNAIISAWTAQGVVGATTVSDFMAPIDRTINYSMNWTLDQQNGGIAEKYLENAGIPNTAYNWVLPGDLDCCNDVFVMPHAEPEWATHSHLLTWNDCAGDGGCGGAIWAGCKAVSELENIYNPADPSERLNFLMLDPIAPITNPAVWSDDHADGSLSYQHNYHDHPVMQFMGLTNGAQESGAEQVYLPTNGWRPSTLIGIEDIAQEDIPSESPGPAAKLAFGYAFGDPHRGYVTYEAAHNLDGSNQAYIAAQRAFLNFSFMAVYNKAIKPVATVPTLMQSGDVYNLSATATGGSGNYYFEWTSDCGGNFIDGNTANAVFIAPQVSATTTCQIHLTVTDDCGSRTAFESITIEIKPIIPEICDNGIDDDGDGLIDFDDPECYNPGVCSNVPGQNDIYGSVYFDEDENQKFETGESGQSGVTLNLYEDNNADGVLDIGDTFIESTVSDGLGGYNFVVTPVFYNTYDATISSGCNDGKDGNNSENRLQFGKDKEIGLRYTGITIPAGATVTYASLYFVAKTSSNKTGRVNIYAHDTATSANFCTNNDVDQRARTTNFTEWSFGNWNAESTYQSENFKDVIQELVNDYGGLSNAQISLLMISTGADNLEAKSYETNNNGTQTPRLVINYRLNTTASYIVEIDESTLPSYREMNTGVTQAAVFNLSGLGDCYNDFGFKVKDEICGNGIDDDGDALIDCADSDCKLITLAAPVVSDCIDHPLQDVATVSVQVSWTNPPANDQIEVSIYGQTERINVGGGASSPQTVTFIVPANGEVNKTIKAAWMVNSSLCSTITTFNVPNACSTDQIGCDILYLCGEDKPYDGDPWDHGFINYLDEVNGANIVVPVLTRPDGSGMGTYDVNDPTTPISLNLNDYGLIVVSATTEAHISNDLVAALKNFSGSVMNSNYTIINDLGMSTSEGGYQFQNNLYINNTASREIYNYNNDINPSYAKVFTRGNYTGAADSYLWTNAGEQALGVNGVFFTYESTDALPGVAAGHGIRVYLGYHNNGLYANAQNGGALPAPVESYFVPATHLTFEGKYYFDQAILDATRNCNVEICNNGIDDDGNGLIDCNDSVCGNVTVSAVAKVNPSNCPVLDNGQLTITATGDDLEYSIDNGATYQASNVFNGLSAGSYIVRVRNSGSGCFENFVNNPVVLAAPICYEICNNGVDDDGDGLTDCADTDCVPTAFAGSDQSICFGNSAILSASVTGGAAPYTYNWDNGLGSGKDKTASPIITTTYSVTVIDAYGCSDSDQLTITVTPCSEVCADGIDNDADGLIDCDDPDCSVVGQPQPMMDSYSTCPGVNYTEQVIFNDNNLQAPIFSIFSQPTKGSVSINNIGKFTYSPFTSSCGNDRFVYQVCNQPSGCCDTASVFLSIGDAVPPVLQNIPADLTISCDEAIPEIPIWVYAIDDCPGIYISYEETSTLVNNSCQNYTISRTWSATDRCGNTSYGTQTITVEDNIAPELFRVYTLPNGKKLVAGIAQRVTNDWKYLNFPIDFVTKPVVFSQVITNNEASAVTVRMRNASIGGVEIRLQEEQISNGQHAYENIAWIAVEEGGVVGEGNFQAELIENVTNNLKTWNYANPFTSTPAVIFSTQTYNDADPIGVRYSNLSPTSVKLFVEEEASLDAELIHGAENVGALAMEAGILEDEDGTFVGESGSLAIRHNTETINLTREYNKPVVILGGVDAGGDPTLIRVSNVTSNSFDVALEEWDYLNGNHANSRVSYLVVEGSVPIVSGFACDNDVVEILPNVNLFVTDNCDNQVTLEYIDSSQYTSSGNLVNKTWRAIDDCGNEASFHQKDTCSLAAVRLRTMLYGALISTSPLSLMNDDLRAKGYVPTEEPYTGMTGFKNYINDGGELIINNLLDITGNNAVVDWVFVEIRDDEKKDSIIITQAALVQRDGDVVTNSGEEVLFFPIEEGNFHVCIRHRNHLGMVTETAEFLNTVNVPLVDFTDNDFVVRGAGTAGHLHANGFRALWSGDLNQDGKVIYQGPSNDVFHLFSFIIGHEFNYEHLANYIDYGYNNMDLNMDGETIYQGPNNDRASILYHTILAHPVNHFKLANFIVSSSLP